MKEQQPPRIEKHCAEIYDVEAYIETLNKVDEDQELDDNERLFLQLAAAGAIAIHGVPATVNIDGLLNGDTVSLAAKPAKRYAHFLVQSVSDIPKPAQISDVLSDKDAQIDGSIVFMDGLVLLHWAHAATAIVNRGPVDEDLIEWLRVNIPKNTVADIANVDWIRTPMKIGLVVAMSFVTDVFSMLAIVYSDEMRRIYDNMHSISVPTTMAFPILYKLGQYLLEREPASGVLIVD